MAEFHNEDTLFKVRETLDDLCDEETSFEILRRLQNKGILFREIRPERTGWEGLDDLLQDFREAFDNLEDAKRKLVNGFRIQLHEMEPVLSAIRVAMNNAPDSAINWKH